MSYLQDRGAPLVSPKDIPPRLAQAIVAIEDERFYQHHGVDTIGIARAALFDATHQCWCQGASTITQQLVKDIYLNGSDRGFNKVVDATIAFKVESVITKAQILADYLSEIPTGPGLFGVEEASCAYFGAPVYRLDLAGYALLAGLAQAPSAYDPLFHPRTAAMRRSEVLDAMLSDGYLAPAAVKQADSEPIVPLHPHSEC
ncbi:MAG TPA: biosynthetic peptidoglycan transglycosylase [Ktedonobacterales bacterium]|nr:biosynthetic peptidoglycan transglycosylase [Ktedonobacterales bacterium]